jgi:hypothetical protein
MCYYKVEYGFKTGFSTKSFLSLTLQHNRLLFFTNHNFVCYGFMAYHIYMRVISALHPKMVKWLLVPNYHEKSDWNHP